MGNDAPPRRPAALLTTNEVAALLRVHPKHVYRLLKRGLPARRVGDEWRYDEADVLAWSRGAPEAEPAEAPEASPPPLLAANGDLAIEALFDEGRERSAPLVGFVLADHATGLVRLESGAVLGAGCHGDHAPASLGGEKLAWLHLAVRELGIAHRKGLRLRRISGIVGRKLASRPRTAGIRHHVDEALSREGVEPERAYAHAEEYRSHRDAVMAVARGDAEVALASRAWAAHAGLGFTPVVAEAYGLVFRAGHLGDPRVLALCELAQSGKYRERLARHAGYDTTSAGHLQFGRSRS
ncbi:helix-turn-helix transcriptional regulator [Polyangium sp. 15x6]|uniref:helix-turn-helix transcriptional regulator n=1 Tax=Polyangium sp. 15x6 TaxID=3042687 RepID=UPI00249A415E|nr:helix-turn-helix transcriptional regulator [Polyangium sp. 15x6]MDI3281854.1 helix-turn-helix transcriptional regulator [Polyangium sp. 15x6]